MVQTHTGRTCMMCADAEDDGEASTFSRNGVSIRIAPEEKNCQYKATPLRTTRLLIGETFFNSFCYIRTPSPDTFRASESVKNSASNFAMTIKGTSTAIPAISYTCVNVPLVSFST